MLGTVSLHLLNDSGNGGRGDNTTLWIGVDLQKQVYMVRHDHIPIKRNSGVVTWDVLYGRGNDFSPRG